MMTHKVGWVTVNACTLPTAEQPLRLAEFDQLFENWLVTVERQSRTRGLLKLVGGEHVAAIASDLTARETNCCSFFQFNVKSGIGGTSIDIVVPDTHSKILEALMVRAEAASRNGVL